MKGNNGIWLFNLAKKGANGINRDVIVFVFFLCLSFIFWYLNSLGKEIETNIRYPVRYINLPKDRVLVDELPERLNLYLKGPGYSILKLKLSGNRAPVIIDVASINYKRVPGSSNFSYYVPSSDLIQKLTTQLRAGCDITTIKPDTLFFSFDRIISKGLPVRPAIEVVTERQYFIKGHIIAEPDSVIVTGPKRVIDTLSSVPTVYRKLTGIRETVKKNVNLLISDHYSASAKKVSLTIPVEQFTEAERVVPVTIINRPDTIDIKIFPDAVTVKCLVAVSDYKRINEIPFEVVLDLKNADLNSSDKIAVEIRNVPAFVNSLRFTPAKVDFIIEKRKQ